jgi:hypothetical protein
LRTTRLAQHRRAAEMARCVDGGIAPHSATLRPVLTFSNIFSVLPRPHIYLLLVSLVALFFAPPTLQVAANYTGTPTTLSPPFTGTHTAGYLLLSGPPSPLTSPQTPHISLYCLP